MPLAGLFDRMMLIAPHQARRRAQAPIGGRRRIGMHGRLRRNPQRRWWWSRKATV